MTGGVAAPSGGCERREAAFTGDKTMTGVQRPPPLGAVKDAKRLSRAIKQ